MTVPVTIRDLSSDGVRLISPDAPEFDALAAPLVGSRAPRVLKMKPALVIVRNDSPRTIVAESLTWRVGRNVGGLVQRTNSQFPEVIVGDTAISRSRKGVKPGECQVVAAGCVVENLDAIDEMDTWIEHFVGERDRMVADSTGIAIELDAVIFDDGQLAGPDENGWLRGMFGSYVTEKQQWYRQILAALDAGASLEDAYSPLRAFQEQLNRDPRRRMQMMREDPNHLWRTQAAAEAAAWRHRYPDDQIPDLLRRSIRLDPFVIR